MKSGGLTEASSAFKGMCFDIDQDDNCFVAEGNHRALVYKALKLIKESVTGEKMEGLTVQGSISRVRNIPRKISDWEF